MSSLLIRDRKLVLPDHFKRLRTNIEPDPDRVALAVDLPDRVRDYLKEHTDFFTRYPHTRLTGSYARYVTIHGIKDVDLIVYIDPGDDDPDSETVLRDLFTALGGLAEALGDTGKPVRRKQRRSINIHFEEADFDLDVVPVWSPNGTDVDDVLKVPDREWERWVETNPRGYGKALSILNGEHAERVVPMIKLIKHWAWHQMKIGKPKGFWLELMVYHAVNDGRVTLKGRPDAVAFRDTIQAIRAGFEPALNASRTPVLEDPMFPGDPDHYVAFNWELADFERFMGRLDESIRWADRAMDKSADEMEDAIDLWQRIFGEDYFQTDHALRRDDGAEHMGRMVTAGAAVVSPTGSVSDRPQPGQLSVPVRPNRFYGDA